MLKHIPEESGRWGLSTEATKGFGFIQVEGMDDVPCLSP
jgi:hypothetical protein